MSDNPTNLTGETFRLSRGALKRVQRVAKLNPDIQIKILPLKIQLTYKNYTDTTTEPMLHYACIAIRKQGDEYGQS